MWLVMSPPALRLPSSVYFHTIFGAAIDLNVPVLEVLHMSIIMFIRQAGIFQVLEIESFQKAIITSEVVDNSKGKYWKR